jgi:hypothetical protein
LFATARWQVGIGCGDTFASNLTSVKAREHAGDCEIDKLCMKVDASNPLYAFKYNEIEFPAL